jgi:xanthine dehydrogenase accessory factor
MLTAFPRAVSRGEESVKDVLDTLERWIDEGLRVATATVVATEKSAPRDPGAVLAVSEEGEITGSVTGGCVEPAVYEEAQAVLQGGQPRLLKYGIADDEAFEVGLPCGGTVHIFVDELDPALVPPIAAAVREEQPVALAVRVEGAAAGEKRLVYPDGEGDAVAARARELLARGESALVELDGGDGLFVSSFAPRPRMYVFGAIDFASALASIGRFLGFHVTVCDARAKFVTPERFPDVDELVVDWPDRFLERSPVDERTAICVLTHDDKFDVPILKAALESPAGYVGAMGSRRTTERRAERLRAEGVTDEALARVHAPIGLRIGSRSPEEVAVAIAAEIISVFNEKAPRVSVKAAAS